MLLEHLLERTVHIAAPRATVFRYFTDSARFAAWWGSGSTIDATPGGRVHIVYPNGIEAGGEVEEVEIDASIVFTYGYASGEPIELGSTRVRIRLEDEAGGTSLTLVHELADPASRDAHVPGWAHQLAVFANVVAAEAHARAGERLDRFFGLWSEGDPGALAAGLAELVAEEFIYEDQYACVRDRESFAGHVLAVQRFFPGAKVERDGDPRQCQGTVLVSWKAIGDGGQAMGSGTNVVRFRGDGVIEEVVAFWDPAG